VEDYPEILDINAFSGEFNIPSALDYFNIDTSADDTES